MTEVVRVRCSHRIGLCYRDGDLLRLLPCDCNEPSEVLEVVADLGMVAEIEDACADLRFDPPEDAAVLTAELLTVAYVRTDGTNGYMVQARGEMPATTYLGMTVMAQDEIKEWGR